MLLHTWPNGISYKEIIAQSLRMKNSKQIRTDEITKVTVEEEKLEATVGCFSIGSIMVNGPVVVEHQLSQLVRHRDTMPWVVLASTMHRLEVIAHVGCPCLIGCLTNGKLFFSAMAGYLVTTVLKSVCCHQMINEIMCHR